MSGRSRGRGLDAVDAAIAFGGELYGEPSDINFDAAFSHILTLLGDAALLFMRQSFGTAAFLAITAIEETAKAHIGVFRRDRTEGRSKGIDPLRNHKQKHHMAILPTVLMSRRLNEVLGQETCARLQREAENDGFTTIREASLYFDRVGDCFATPATAVSAFRAWELVLLAIEALDDNLIGYTNYSMAQSEHVNTLFNQIAAMRPES
ncbi:AbiV family abortive infection protein [Methylorubrum sp. POS3]|uniref:AbiV family abortive infection protein n=1 Tax=Methylorubrum sp. POS3 TaxID=2998492 RepID=UPI003727757D